MQNNRVIVATEINIHQAARAVVSFARKEFGGNDPWFTENEAVDLLAAAQQIHNKVTARNVNAIQAAESEVGRTA